MDTFVAISDPTRRRVLELLSRQERAAGELCRAFPSVSRPGVSRHLRVLLQAGLVHVRKQDRHRVYSLRWEGLAPADAWLSKFRGFWEEELDSLESFLETHRSPPTGTDARGLRP
jgi:DNA-binding transcriptional ArsR family regulator